MVLVVVVCQDIRPALDHAAQVNRKAVHPPVPYTTARQQVIMHPSNSSALRETVV